MKRTGFGDTANVMALCIIGLITLYPFIYILSVSITPSSVYSTRKVFLWPYGFDLSTYAMMFNDSRIVSGFKNSIIYTFFGVIINVFFTMLTAYPLANESFKKYGSFFMKMIIFTMLFSGGLIPAYLLVRNLGFINTIWAIIIPGAISPFYLILARTFIQQLPKELTEASVIDGAGEATIFMRIILPLCKPIIACISLYYAVALWNSYFAPLIYLTDPKKYPLQVYLQQIVLGAQMAEQQQQASQMAGYKEARIASEAVKSCTLVISTVPVLILYPFLQKYFVKGIMIGAVKG